MATGFNFERLNALSRSCHGSPPKADRQPEVACSQTFLSIDPLALINKGVLESFKSRKGSEYIR